VDVVAPDRLHDDRSLRAFDPRRRCEVDVTHPSARDELQEEKAATEDAGDGERFVRGRKAALARRHRGAGRRRSSLDVFYLGRRVIRDVRVVRSHAPTLRAREKTANFRAALAASCGYRASQVPAAGFSSSSSFFFAAWPSGCFAARETAAWKASFAFGQS